MHMQGPNDDDDVIMQGNDDDDVIMHSTMHRPWRTLLELLPIFLFQSPIFLNYAGIDSEKFTS